MKRAVAALAVACLLAGCSGGIVGSAPTATPAPVPTDRPTSTTAPTVAPGLSLGGVHDADALFAAHRARLANRSYTRQSTLHVVAPGGSTYYRQTTRARYDGDGRVLVTGVREGPHLATLPNGTVARYTAYRNATLRATRLVERDGDTRLLAVDVGPTVARPSLTVLERRLRTERHRVAAVEGGYVLRSRGLDWRSFSVPAFLASPREVVSRTVVTSDGLIRETRVRYRARVDDREVRVTRTVRFVYVGETTVRRPGWVGRAATNASR